MGEGGIWSVQAVRGRHQAPPRTTTMLLSVGAKTTIHHGTLGRRGRLPTRVASIQYSSTRLRFAASRIILRGLFCGVNIQNVYHMIPGTSMYIYTTDDFFACTDTGSLSPNASAMNTAVPSIYCCTQSEVPMGMFPTYTNSHLAVTRRQVFA